MSTNQDLKNDTPIIHLVACNNQEFNISSPSDFMFEQIISFKNANTRENVYQYIYNNPKQLSRLCELVLNYSNKMGSQFCKNKDDKLRACDNYIKFESFLNNYTPFTLVCENESFWKSLLIKKFIETERCIVINCEF